MNTDSTDERVRSVPPKSQRFVQRGGPDSRILTGPSRRTGPAQRQLAITATLLMRSYAGRRQAAFPPERRGQVAATVGPQFQTPTPDGGPGARRRFKGLTWTVPVMTTSLSRHGVQVTQAANLNA